MCHSLAMSITNGWKLFSRIANSQNVSTSCANETEYFPEFVALEHGNDMLDHTEARGTSSLQILQMEVCRLPCEF